MLLVDRQRFGGKLPKLREAGHPADTARFGQLNHLPPNRRRFLEAPLAPMPQREPVEGFRFDLGRP